ncbi:MAG: recombinase family protein [Planctomycetes bacterium]|nr:recombinase family protein [Planctomycetota bacterium]
MIASTNKASSSGASRVGKLMKNPTYKGAICWNKHSMGSLFGLDGNGGLRPRQKRGWKKNAEADWIISEGVHEPLVSVETWNAAQDAARKRATLGGKARPTNRSLLSSLMVCKRCGCSFTIARDRRHAGPEGDGNRGYRCCGYHRYGKSTCGFYQVSAPTLEAFVVDAIKQTIVGKHKEVRSAIEAFIQSIRKPTQAAKPTKDVANEVALLNRKIKAMIGMLSDPTFDGLDELKTTLADLKAKRDALESQASAVAKKAIAIPSADELRRWAIERFGRIDEYVCKANPTLQDRQLVEAFVDRIEIEPDAKQATVYLFADLETAYKNGFTRDPRGDELATHWQPRRETGQFLFGSLLSLSVKC